jgi:hypothetical protein
MRHEAPVQAALAAGLSLGEATCPTRVAQRGYLRAVPQEGHTTAMRRVYRRTSAVGTTTDGGH